MGQETNGNQATHGAHGAHRFTIPTTKSGEHMFRMRRPAGQALKIFKDKLSILKCLHH